MTYLAAFRSLRDVWRIALAVVAIDAGIELIWNMFFSALGYNLLWVMEIENAVKYALWCYFSAPLAIAIHRHLLLGEARARYVTNLSLPRFRRYLHLLLVVTFLRYLGFIVCLFGQSAEGAGLATAHLAQGAAFVILLGLILYFPAVATDADTADWRRSLSALRGHGWRVGGELFAILLPVFLLDNAIRAYILFPLGDSAYYSDWYPAVESVMAALSFCLWLTVFATVASRWYRVICGGGERADPVLDSTRMPLHAAGLFVVVGLFLVLRASYFLPIETQLPASVSLRIAKLYWGTPIVEQSNYEAYRWYLIATRKSA